MEAHPPELRNAARAVVDSEDFQKVMKHYSTYLQEAVLDSNEDKDILAARREYDSVRNFVEYLHTVATPLREHN